MISGPVIPWTREGLWGQILKNPDLLEQGLGIVAHDLQLRDNCTVDGVARDAGGRAVLLLAAIGTENPGIPVSVLEAHAFMERNAAVLARVLPDSGIRFTDGWRVVVVGLDLPPACLERISALGLERVEVLEIEPFSLDGKARIVVRPVLGHRANGGEDGLHVPTGLIDPERRSLCASFLQRLRRMDSNLRVEGDRFSRRLTTGGAALAELRVEGNRVFVQVGQESLELVGDEECLEIVDLVLRRYLGLLATPAPGNPAREVVEPAASGVALRGAETGLSLEPLRRTVAETRISKEEYSALGETS
jgi:hypothetical protein